MPGLKFSSTRGGASSVGLSEAMQRGLAPDGGLYLPERLPAVELSAFTGVESLTELGRLSLGGFFAGDGLESSLRCIADAALDVEAPTTRVAASADPLFVLELYHGPTAAFKDFGARFLAESLQCLEAGPRQAGPRQAGPRQPLTLMVATSGDTGGAVAAAFHRRPWVRVVILYPRGQVSSRQEQQLTCWGDNVMSLRIDGTFDDCQRLVKEAFVDATLNARHRFSSANSINIGRLLPQMVYYVASSLAVQRRTSAKASFIVPAGNLGNAFAAVWARELGFPIERIVLAHNANRTVPDYLQSGEWRPRPSIPTLASAMDVGNPSNMERLRAVFPDLESMRGRLSADSVDDETIRARIGLDHARFARVWCPHTATAAELYHRLGEADRRERPWVLVATAHPAKFHEIIEPLVGALEVPDGLARLLSLPRHYRDIPPTLAALASALE